MKKSRVGKRILAWMLVFAMLWQSAGVETLAASITASDGVETLTEEGEEKASAAEDTNVSEQPADNGAGTDNDTGITDGDTGSSDTAENIGDTGSSDTAGDIGDTGNSDSGEDKQPGSEITADEVTSDLFSAKSEEEVKEPAVILNGIADGTTTQLQTWTAADIEGRNPLEAAEEEIKKGEYSSYSVEIEQDLTVPAYTQTEDRSNTTLYLHGHTLTIEGDGYSFGTYTVNVEGISNDENKTFGTIKFVVKSATVDQNNTVTIGADFQSSQDTSDVYLNWQNMNIEVANDGDTSTSTDSVTVKLGEHNRVTWNEVSYNTSNGIKKKLETAMNSNLTVNDETEFVTDDVFITKWSSLTVKNKWKTTNATFDLKQSSVNAKEMEIENLTMKGDSKLFTQKSCTVNKIISNDANELLLVAEKTADVVEWPIFHINSEINDFQIRLQRDVVDVAGTFEDWGTFSENDQVAILGADLIAQIKSSGKDVNDYFVADGNVEFALDEATCSLTVVAKPEDQTKLYWIYQPGEDAESYQTGVDTLAEAKEWIAEQPENDVSYVIRVNTSQVNADKTVSAGKNDLNYREQGHAVLLDLQEQVLTLTDADTVMTTSATNGQIRVSKAGSLTVYPDNSDIRWSNLTVNMNNLSEKLIVGEQNVAYSGRLVTENVEWTNTGKLAVTMAANVDLTGQTLNCASLKVVGESYEVSDGKFEKQEVSIGTLKVIGNLELNGVLTVHFLENVGGTLTAVSGSTMTLTERGVINNLLVKGSGSELEAEENFELRMVSPDNVSDHTLLINGSVSRSGKMVTPVLCKGMAYNQETGKWEEKPFGWNKSNEISERRYEIYMPKVRTALDGFFTSDLYADSEHKQVITLYAVCEKTGTGYGVRAKEATVLVKHANMICRFDSFEYAVASISKLISSGGFGNDKGKYTFVLLASGQLKNNVTLPSCVTDLEFITYADEPKNLETGKVQYLKLDGSGKKVILKTTASTIYISPFVDIRNGTLEAPSATEIHMGRFSEYKLEGGYDEQWTAKGDDLTINAPNAAFYANAITWSEDKHQKTENAVFDMSEATLNVASLVSRGSTEAGTYISGDKLEVQFKKLTLNSGSTSFDGKVTIPTLVQQGGSVKVESGAAVDVTTWNVTKAVAKDAISGYETIYNDGGQVKIDTLNMTAGTLYNGGYPTKDGTASVTISTVKRLKKLVNDDQAVFHVHNYASVNGDAVWLNDESLFVVDSQYMGEGETDQPGTVVLYGLRIAGTPVIQKSLSDTLTINGTPVQADEESRCTVKIHEPDKTADALLKQVAFNTSMTSGFPLEMFNVTAELRDGDNSDAAREEYDFMLQQNGKQLLIAKALFAVTQKGIKEGSRIGEYANWQQVVAAINNINDAKNEYEIQVLDDTVTIDGTFTIPSKAASLDFSYEQRSGAELCTLTWYGNVSLPTNVTFQNFWLTPKATAKEGAAPASVALNRNTFYLENSGGVFTNVTGSANSVWQIVTGDSTVLPSEASAWVEARGSVSGIAHLILSGKPDHTPTLQVTSNVTATKLTMNDAAWLKTVGVRNNNNQMTSGKITLANVITNGEDNKVSYPGENTDSMLYVTEKVDSDGDYHEAEGEKAYYLSCAITVDTEGIYNTKTADHQLLSAKNAPASWFVTENEKGEKQWTEKSGEWVIIARTAAPSVALNYGSYNEKGNIYGYFGTVKEAFGQIQFLNDPTADYVISILKDSATNVNENLGFPTKVHRLYVVNETESSIKFSFKNLIELNSNTTFVELDLVPQTSGGSIKVKNYELELDSCYIPTGNKITGITGNGKGQVTVRNSVSKTGKNEDETSTTCNFTVNGSISGLSVLKVQSDHSAGLYVTGNVTATNLELANNVKERETALLEVDGKLTVTDVITKGDCSVQASVTLTRNTRSTDKEITRVTPNFIINGTVKGDPLKLSVVEMVKTGTTLTAQEVLFKDRSNEEAPLAGYVWGSTYKTVNDNQETVYKNIPLVLAKKTAAAKIVLNTTDSDVQKGMLYKSGGYINYMSTTDYAIELTYKTTDSDGTKADQQTPCLTWADAVTEINNQAAGNSNAKNTEYTITLKTDLGSAKAEKTAPISLLLPGRNAAANVIVTSEGDAKNIYYQGNITANTGLTLKNVNLNSKVRVNGTWTNVIFDGDPKTCVKPITLTVAGAYTLNLGDNVTFNSPLILKGNNAATLKLTAVTGKTLKTVGNRSEENTGATEGNLIYGSVTGFTYVDLNTDKNTNDEDANGKLYVEKYVTGKDRKGNWIYTDGAFTVVKDLTLRNAQLKAASVTVNGNVTMTDSQVEADGVFTFNKDLAYTGSKNALTTIRKSAADLTPYLTIKGNVASKDGSTIRVKVLNSDGTVPTLAVMGDTFTAAQKTACRRFLVAPKADISLFVPDSENLKAGNENPYETGKKTGYIFFRDKSGYVNIYYADEVQAAVYVEDEELLGYYVTWADAVAAVNAYKSSNLASETISIVLCKNLGEAVQPVNLTLPSTKATVEITACDVNSDRIYYNNNISLRSNTVFRGIMLAPTAVKTVKGVKKAYGISRDIAVGSYSFTMDTVVVSGVDASIGSITGAGSKTAEYEFDGDENTRYDLTGKLAITNGTVYIRKNVAVQAAGALSVQTLVLHAGAELYGKAAMKIGDIVYTNQLTNPPMIGTWRTVEKKGLDNSQFTLTGGVYAGVDENGKPAGADEGKIILAVHENDSTEEDPRLIDATDYELIYNRTGDSNVKLTVPATKKLADIPKEYLSHFKVGYNNTDNTKYHLVKYAGGVYLGTDSLKSYEVELDHADESTTCLDLNQAATEIANLAALTDTYTVKVPTELTDTCITDATAASSLVLPKANKAASVVYTNKIQRSEVRFLAADGMKPAGIVTFENFVFDPVVIKNNKVNVANPALTMSASTMTVDGKKTSVSRVTLENCSFKNAQTLFASVTGVRNVSTLTMDGCKIGVLGTMQYVNDLDLLNGTDLATLGTVSVNAVTMKDTDAKASTWNAWGATTISTSLTSWMKNKGSYIGTRRVDAKTGKSAFTVNGSASTGKDRRIWIKVMKDTTTQADVLNAYKIGTLTSAALYRGGSSADPTETYKDISLLAAPKADAGIFRAHYYQTASDDVLANLISYKDLNYNVKNGDKREMAVEITRESDEKSDATTYAKTFSQAVTMINRAGTGVKAADYDAYTMTILTANAERENGQPLVKTAQDGNQAPAYGSLTLPTYAKAVTIKSDSTSAVPTLKFTGAVTPRCDTTFDGVKLVAGTVSGGKWQTAKEQAPTISMSNTRWTLTLPKKSDTYTSITAPQGQIVIPAGADVTVNGAVSAKTLSLAGELHVKGNLTATTLTAASNDAAVTGEKVMTFTDLTKHADDAALKLTTYRTARPANKISRTQLVINGEITVPTSIQMMVYDQKKINGKLEDTHAFGMNDMKDYELGVNGKPTENVKLAVIPKASLADVTLLVEDSDTSYAKNLPLWKYEKGMYLAESKYAVNNGGLPIIVTAQEDGTSVYEASFMNWAQAVKEIDVIAKKARTYTIMLTENAGDNGTIGTLTMPAQAAKLTVKSNDDHGRYVFFTGTAITLRCPTEFDRIGLIGVLRKASGKTVWYENRAYTLNAGNYDLTMKNMLESGNFEYKANQGNTYAYLSAIPSRISGGTKSILTWEMTTNWSNGDNFYYVNNMQTQPAEQITGFGTVDLKLSDKFDHKVGSTVVQVRSKEAILSVPKGISGISSLKLNEGVTLNVTAGNVAVKDAQINGYVKTRNYTSTGTTTMHLGVIDAGMWVKNTVTGAVRMNQVKLETMDNQIIGRKNRSNVSQIVITGAVSKTDSFDKTATSENVAVHAPIIICLTEYARNSKAQLVNGMVLLQAPKVTQEQANEIFAPKYSRYDAESGAHISGMGTVPDGAKVMMLKPARTNNLTWNMIL
ncbi:hypothetical protein [Hominiventricola aquisgranensis]|uniref:Uncharacterized protein n=1 Tax=Hominiventricola aquisgranensis TaxID=3133164 RepID=A0ABV1I2G3_9FIRM